MLFSDTASANATPPPPADLIKDSSDANFLVDVLEASRTTPVIVDFWATWCGPCKQLTPIMEKVVKAANGAVKLVKIDVDKNPQVSQQLRIQSMPTVYAFVDGRPVDVFQGALPESQVKQFIDRLTGPAGPSEIDEVLALAAESLEHGDVGGAARAYAEVLQAEPENTKAIAGLARIYLTSGDAERAQAVLDMAPPGAKSPDLDAVRAALKLASNAKSETSVFESRLAADPNDHEARLELAKVLAGRGQFQEAADHLLSILGKDRAWSDGAARQQLLEVFQAAGPTSEVAKQGRRRLSSILFS